MNTVLHNSRALWNRTRGELESDEVLAQLLDRGDVRDWRELFRLARTDDQLRHRIMHVVTTVPTPLPYFWLAALASLGEPVDWNAPVPKYFDSSAV